MTDIPFGPIDLPLNNDDPLAKEAAEAARLLVTARMDGRDRGDLSLFNSEVSRLVANKLLAGSNGQLLLSQH